jgi:TatD DNase family protein
VVDTHCRLDSCKQDDAELVERARATGVTRLATVGMDGESIERAIAAAHDHDEVVAIVGRHPNLATGFTDVDLLDIERAAHDPRARAIGETGLDYYRDRAPRKDQLLAFQEQVELARQLDLPVVIHTRDAEEDTFAVLREQAQGVTVILHCFSATGRVEECVERGWFCSFAGNVTYPKAQDLATAAERVPDERLLVETDAPYLTPQVVRKERNQPAYVAHTARFVAERRGVGYDELEAVVERNAAELFGW